MASPQIPLQLQPSDFHQFESFVAGPNQAVVDALQATGPDASDSLFLQGSPASGKTHLLNACCTETRAQGGIAWHIGLARVGSDAAAGLKGLQGTVCFDDLHAVVGDATWEEALFHCFNEVRSGGGRVIVSSREPLSALRFSLPDLASRMAWGLRVALKPLNDEERLEVLRTRARQLELEVPPEVEQFLMRRISRNPGTLADLLEKLQARVLAEKRRVTVPLAREVLHEAQPPEGDA